MAISDLKGLGAREGPPVVYGWTLPSLMPLLLPWLAVLALLALPRNRSGRAWWVLLPLGIWAGLSLGLQVAGSSDVVPSEMIETFAPLLSAGAFGFAAMLLLGYVLARQPWPLVFLGMCAAQTLFSMLAMVAGADADSLPTQLALLVVLTLCGLGVILALALAGLFCRRRYSALRLSGWVMVWLLAGWFLLAMPLCIIALLGDAFVPLPGILLGAAMMAAACFVAILPFLILCFTNSFYRERLQAMFGIPAATVEPPPPSRHHSRTPGRLSAPCPRRAAWDFLLARRGRTGYPSRQEHRL